MALGLAPLLLGIGIVSRAVLLLPLLWMLACGGGRALPLITDAASVPDPSKPALPIPDPDDDTAWAVPRWECETKPDGRHFCRKAWPDTGLPPGSGWLCHLARHLGPPRWICHGNATSLPAITTLWSCARLQDQTVRCEKHDMVGADRPPDAGTWVCVKGKVYGGTLCERVSDPNPPDLITGGPCVPGQRLWCDGRVYDAWGHVECDPATRRWKTVVVGGKAMLDCDEGLPGGKLPLTRCALHHYFFTPLCCERTDCIVPDGTGGQPYAKNAGGFCDPCNPLKPECTEPGAKCIATQSLETFCGRLCSDATPCPAGSECVDVKYKVGGTKQCVPQDLSCYF